MKGDFSRNTFDPKKRYSRVLMQQGRVQMDADWNEQLDIATHRAATESVDVIGPAGAPTHAAAFGLVLDPTTLTAAEQARVAALGLTPLGAGNFLLTPGRFYAAGTPCEAEDFLSLAKQPDFPGAAAISEAGFHLVYLDVWQRHLTALDDGAIRETALGGPDTATRVKTIWQVKTAKVDQPKCISDAADWAKIVTPSTGHLTARAKPGEDTDTPCVLPPGAGYRRLENQLYRVEIHQPGERGKATFKWSRDNGTVVTKLAGPINGKEVKVDDLGRDAVLGFNPGDWVELLDDATDLNGVSGVLAQIDIIERATKKVVLKAVPAFAYVKERNPKMRRWDDPHGERKVELGPEENDGFLELEDGVQVKFAGGYFNTGDYWLIPARTATNGVEWPLDPKTGNPVAQPPLGITHTCCCLAYVTATKAAATITLSDPHDCRDLFIPLTELEDAEEARRRHNRLLHGWGVVCGLQVHCGGDRQSVQIEPGYALQCDGSEAFLPPPGRNFDVVAAARKQADLLKNSNGRVALTMAADQNKQISFGVRKLAGDGSSYLQTILKGTLLRDVYHDCVEPVFEFAQKEFFTDDTKDKRLVNETVRRRTAAINLAVQFVNQSAGRHVLLSAREHDLLEQVHEDLKKYLTDPVYCGVLDGLGAFPDYPFKEQGALTAFGKAPMTRVRVSPDGHAACAFGGEGDAKVYVFDLAKAEMVAEIELKTVVGTGSLLVRDVAFYARGTRMMVTATSGEDSVLYSYKVSKTGAKFELINDPLVLGERQLLRLGQISEDDRFLYGLLQGAGLVRFDPAKFVADDFIPLASFNATGHWVLGTGAGVGLIYATAAASATGETDHYTQVLVYRLRAEPVLVQTIKLPQAGSDGIGVLFRTAFETPRVLTESAKVSGRLYVAVDPPTGTGVKRLLVYTDGADPVAAITLPTVGPVSLAPTAGHQFMMVTLAEQYLLGWINPAKNQWLAVQTLPTQMHPTAVATATILLKSANQEAFLEKPMVVVVNRDSHTLSVLPAGLVSATPSLKVSAVVEYRAGLVALYRALGLRLLQHMKDCLCEHLRVNCPVCADNDVIELAAVDIREGKVYHICNSRRREVVTFPKLNYWLSAIPVIPVLNCLVREFCCLVLPDFFKPATATTAVKDTITASSMLKMREQLTPARFTAIKKEALARIGLLGGVFLNATKAQAIAPFKPDIAVRAGELVESDEETVKRRLADSGVIVNTVADYDEAFAEKRWQNLADLQFDFKPGDRVNLLVKDGKVAMITTAKAAAPAGDVATAPGLVQEVARLNAKLADMQVEHAASLAASEKEMNAVKANLEKFNTILSVRSTARPRIAAKPRPKRKSK